MQQNQRSRNSSPSTTPTDQQINELGRQAAKLEKEQQEELWRRYQE